MTEGYIFDYGGTLDTGGQHWGQAIWHAYERHKLPVSQVKFREAYVYAERLLGRKPIILPSDTFRMTLETKIRLQMENLGMDYETYGQMVANDLYQRTETITAKSRRVLQDLQVLGVPMVLVSNFYGNISVVLHEFGFEGLFQAVIESAVVGVRKPDPGIFLLGTEALGLSPSQVTVVGDSLEKDIIPAHKAGCHTVWFRGEGWNAQPDSAPEADRVIKNLDELLKKV